MCNDKLEYQSKGWDILLVDNQQCLEENNTQNDFYTIENDPFEQYEVYRTLSK